MVPEEEKMPLSEKVDTPNRVLSRDEQYSQLQALMIRILSTYINIDPDQVETVIHHSLKEMAEFVNADRAYIFEYDFEKSVCNNTYEWCREGISAEIDNLQNVPIDFIPNWISIHRRGEAYYMPDINLLPNNGPFSVRGLLEPQGVKSLITLPMKLNDELVGFVGFDSVYNFHAYSEKERDLLAVFSQMLINITERKRQSEALVKAKNEAEQASKTKEIFLATLSHEIRTPLNVITGMVREMLKHDLPLPQRALMSNAKSAAVHLLSVLNNILDLSKIESGEFVLDRVVFDIKALVADALAIMSLKAREKNLELNVLIDPEMQTAFEGDEGRLRQVLINLIDNAIKFTETGSVNVKIWSEQAGDDKKQVHMKVADTGIGMSPEFIGSVFSKFSQEHNATTRRYQGVGLGLNIVKNLVQQMGGDIDVTSTKGKGSEFHLYVLLDTALPNQIPVKSIPKEHLTDFTGRRILIVEDNELNRYVAYLSLKALNCTVLEAENGEVAIELLKREAVDLIIMDVQMPVMDGVETTRIIREELKLTTPIVALTANAFRHNAEQYLQAGMNAYIAKPFLEKDFFDVVAKYLSTTMTRAVPTVELLYDLDYLRELCKNEEIFMQNMMRIFIRVVEEAIPQFDQLRNERDARGLQKLAHKLKPSIDHLAISKANQVVRLLENADKEGLNANEQFALFDDMLNVLMQVADQLEDYLKENSLANKVS
ncbi:MAG: ATP-binding protein [Paludibacter sp.]|jgi:signal transduction histidine kinase/CheY-like chemotaxis protein/HPt (histidine-containing phosphotransfer) domain-containing protein|nr:ATP-binding protein [Paludibacter sp.]